MRNKIMLLAGILLVALPVHAEDCSSLDSIRWLVGEWATTGEGKQVLESWTAVSADTLEGVGAVRSPETGEISVSETLRLVAMSGNVYYVAKVPENDLPVPFAMTSCDDSSASFTNALHDFPKRITYQRDGPDRIRVSVRGDGDQGFTLAFERQSRSDNH
jgi:hypothetical protein